MRKPPHPNLLLVEGQSDAVVANHLADWYGLPDAYDDVQYQGIEPLLRALPGRLKESERKRVAVIVDADDDLTARWRSVRVRLERLGYTVPRQPAIDGTIIEPPHGGLPRVGVWIMPDNATKGILENFLQSLIPPGDALLLRAKQCVAEIPVVERLFPDPRVPKAEIYTWLAWQETPGCSFGPTIKAGLLNGDHPLARRFIDWLRRLFELSAEPNSEVQS
jgi:Protein of unknown function (DUF3226)